MPGLQIDGFGPCVSFGADAHMGRTHLHRADFQYEMNYAHMARDLEHLMKSDLSRRAYRTATLRRKASRSYRQECLASLGEVGEEIPGLLTCLGCLALVTRSAQLLVLDHSGGITFAPLRKTDSSFLVVFPAV